MRLVSTPAVCIALVLAVAAGCYVGPIEAEPGEATRGTAGTDPAAAAGGAPAGPAATSVPGGAAATGLPCEIDALLAARCRSCHSNPPSAPMALLTYEDLAAPAKSDTAKSNAVVALERMKSEARPMPPAGDKASAAELAAFETWVSAGLPRGTCGGAAPLPDGGVPPATPTPVTPAPLVCTSNQTWNPSNDEGPNMNPGRACITCHRQEGEGSIVVIGGTVYPTVREPDLCYGVNGGAVVVITDANNVETRLNVGTTGNFSLRNRAVAFPIRARVEKDGKVRAMSSPQMIGDCNSCHTTDGANGAPGRIFLP